MRRAAAITTLLLDVGGVLLSNGWDHVSRRRAARKFGLDWDAFDARHRLVFELHERGRMTLDEYLDAVVFERPRLFSRAEFRGFMFAQSSRLPGMIDFVRGLKARHGLKVVVVSNESRALNAHRIRAFGLDEFVDVFVSSCFVGARKPDAEIFRIALDVAQADAGRALFIDDTEMFVGVAAGLGVRGFVHRDLAATRRHAAALGLTEGKTEVEPPRRPTQKRQKKFTQSPWSPALRRARMAGRRFQERHS
jgi:putative hydrolase of the HAD superfamily